ncbi:hypothetical protein [Candidatus Methylacidithermus pantelleriae]|uniref:Uncharacterized protein n=1 Tax=Candidatus Methylacidithermus pantelleriae TaxID=2744239 RepID=A0A8J2BNB9_9BACT|nr:hypothetical protein [Candidatus Methylacidithermus pantelleriae]CAF0698501.1 hypothetical protein MPNT_280006 [Candidatus Methylacidithermus pantelleriae]
MVNAASVWERELGRAAATIAAAERWPKALRGLARNQGRLNHIFYYLFVLLGQEAARNREERERLQIQLQDLNEKISALASTLEGLELRLSLWEGDHPKGEGAEKREPKALEPSNPMVEKECARIWSEIAQHRRELVRLESRLRELGNRVARGSDRNVARI